MTLLDNFKNPAPVVVRAIRTLSSFNGEIPAGTETRAIPDPLTKAKWCLEIPSNGKCLLTGEYSRRVGRKLTRADLLPCELTYLKYKP